MNQCEASFFICGLAYTSFCAADSFQKQPSIITFRTESKMPATSYSSSSESEEKPKTRKTIQEIQLDRILEKMMCWLVKEGYHAMKKSLKHKTPLGPRTDLGDHGVRMEEIRQMTSAAYASGRPTRVPFWYNKLSRKKKVMRDLVDEHLRVCSSHEKYKTLRDKIDSLRDEKSSSEVSSPIRNGNTTVDKENEVSDDNENDVSDDNENEASDDDENEESGDKENKKSETNKTIPEKNNSLSNKSHIPKINLRQKTHLMRNESLTMEVELPVRKPNGVKAMKKDSQEQKRGREDTEESDSSETDKSSPSKKQRINGEA